MRRVFPAVLLLLAGCASVKQATQSVETKITDTITPYRLDVRQGNYVNQSMAAQLKPGMTRDQVRFILGTPLVADPFHADRWDYVYRYQHGHEPPQERRLTVFFEGGKLARVSGDVEAAESGKPLAEPAPEARVVDVPPDPNGPKTEPENRPRETDEQGGKKRSQGD